MKRIYNKLFFIFILLPLFVLGTERNWNENFEVKFKLIDSVEEGFRVQSERIKELPVLKNIVDHAEKEPIDLSTIQFLTTDNFKKLIKLIKSINKLKKINQDINKQYINKQYINKLVNRQNIPFEQLFIIISLLHSFGYSLQNQNMLINVLFSQEPSDFSTNFFADLSGENNITFEKKFLMQIVQSLTKNNTQKTVECIESINVENPEGGLGEAVGNDVLAKIEKDKAIRAFCCHPIEDYCVAGLSSNGDINIFKFNKSTNVIENKGCKSVQHLCFSADGYYLAAVLNKGLHKNKLCIWNTKSWNLEESNTITDKPIMVSEFDFEIKHIAFGYQDKLIFSQDMKSPQKGSKIHVWDKVNETWQDRLVIESEKIIYDLSANPTNDYIAYRDQEKVLLYSLSLKKIVKAFSTSSDHVYDKPAKGLCFNKAGNYLIFLDGGLYVRQIGINDLNKEHLIQYREIIPKNKKAVHNYQLGIQLNNNCFYVINYSNKDQNIINFWDIDFNLKEVVKCGNLNALYNSIYFNAEGNRLIIINKIYLVVYNFPSVLLPSQFKELDQKQLLYYIYRKLKNDNVFEEKYADIYNSLPELIKDNLKILYSSTEKEKTVPLQNRNKRANQVQKQQPQKTVPPVQLNIQPQKQNQQPQKGHQQGQQGNNPLPVIEQNVNPQPPPRQLNQVQLNIQPQPIIKNLLPQGENPVGVNAQPEQQNQNQPVQVNVQPPQPLAQVQQPENQVEINVQAQQNQQRPQEIAAPQQNQQPQQLSIFRRFTTKASQLYNDYKKWIWGGIVAGGTLGGYYLWKKLSTQKEAIQN